MKHNAILLALACLVLASCGGEPAKSSGPTASSSDSPSSSSKAAESSSKAESSSVLTSESTSSEETSSSESTPASSSSEQSSEQSSELSSSSSEVPSSSEQTSSDSSASSSASTSSNWTLTRADIPETTQSQYNRDFDFEVQSESGPVILHGDYIQQGTGSNAEFIQMRKRTNNKTSEEERIYFYVTEGSYTSIEFEIQHKVLAYNQQDVTGVPAIYSAEEINESNGQEVEIEMELSQDGTMYHCTAELPYGQFRFENASPSYALYMTYFTAIA